MAAGLPGLYPGLPRLALVSSFKTLRVRHGTYYIYVCVLFALKLTDVEDAGSGVRLDSSVRGRATSGQAPRVLAHARRGAAQQAHRFLRLREGGKKVRERGWPSCDKDGSVFGLLWSRLGGCCLFLSTVGFCVLYFYLPFFHGAWCVASGFWLVRFLFDNVFSRRSLCVCTVDIRMAYCSVLFGRSKIYINFRELPSIFIDCPSAQHRSHKRQEEIA